MSIRPKQGSLKAVESLLDLLPSTPSPRNTHKTYTEVFRSSRLASIPINTEDASFFTRHIHHYPTHQVLTSFNAAHRRGEWGLKRRLPPVKDSHIVVPEIDTQETLTPFNFATEKPRFVRMMKEIGVRFEVPNVVPPMQYRMAMRLSRRPKSPLGHLHVQWNRTLGNETGPNIMHLSQKEFDKLLDKLRNRQQDWESMVQEYDQNPADPSSDRKIRNLYGTEAKSIISAYLDLPTHSPVYKIHPTAGLTYSVKGYMPSTPEGARANYPKNPVGLGRIVHPPDSFYKEAQLALFYGVVARVLEGLKNVPLRTEPVQFELISAAVDSFGKLDLVVKSLKVLTHNENVDTRYRE